jgi:hypothetical protein
MEYFPLLLFGGGGAILGLIAGAIVGIHRYREALGLGCAMFIALFTVWGILGSGDDKWQWLGFFAFANVLAFMVFLGLGCAIRGALNRVVAA